MGLLSARIVEAWLLVTDDVKLRTVKHVENDTANKKVIGWLEQSDHFVVVQRRHFVGLVKFAESCGDTGTSFRWYIGGGRTMSVVRIGRIAPADKYVCTGDKIDITDYVIGEGWQEQVWELQSKFKPVAGSYYEEDADV